MLGEQSWSKPNTFDTYQFERAAGLHDSLIVACICRRRLQPLAHRRQRGLRVWVLLRAGVQCAWRASAVVFRSRRNIRHLRLSRSGRSTRKCARSGVWRWASIRTGPILHDVAFGGEVFHRNVYLPGAAARMPPPTVQDGAVFAYVGSENIYQPNIPFPIEDPVQSAGPSQLAGLRSSDRGDRAGSHRSSGPLRLTASGRYTSLRDFNVTVEPKACGCRNIRPRGIP